MIVKTFQLNSSKLLNSFILFYGNNDGYKNDIIEQLILKNFDGEILKYDEYEVLINKEDFISNLKNSSLFEERKIIFINRITDKFFKLISDIISYSLKDVMVVLNSETLEKKSKIRQLFEKDKKLICVPFYEDDNKTLNILANNFFKKEKIKISQENINLLVDRAKGDRKNLNNELSKIKNLSLTKKNIGYEDLLKLTNLAENYSVFELAENYLAKNIKKVSNILNENNYTNEDCILILRTILNRSKRLLKLKQNQQINDWSVDLTISSFKPPIFWKEKEIVKRQINLWTTKEIKLMIYKINNLEILIKKNTNNSINIISDFVFNY
tara:strand:- start:794 stop:1771 length:978 start_codon:yes stop_codon:yes gene_type:complete